MDTFSVAAASVPLVSMIPLALGAGGGILLRLLLAQLAGGTASTIRSWALELGGMILPAAVAGFSIASIAGGSDWVLGCLGAGITTYSATSGVIAAGECQTAGRGLAAGFISHFFADTLAASVTVVAAVVVSRALQRPGI